ncbi:MAG: hypothetical protein K0R69_3145 [Clostridia bacterium]|nr:hypothetical protein [Clostridia bacterium]
MRKAILKNDLQYMKRDPMVWMSILTPFIFIVIYKVFVLRLDFFKPYQEVIQYIFIVMIPFLAGMVIGFRVLDEKDEHMISFYAVSPLGIKGYVKLRMMMTAVLAAVGIIVMALFEVVPKEHLFFIGIQAVLLAPVVGLVVSVWGKNKIQGLTLVKIIGMLSVLPVLKVIGENPLDRIFVLIPSYNLFELIVASERNDWTLFYTGILGASIYLLMEYFNKKCIHEV